MSVADNLKAFAIKVIPVAAGWGLSMLVPAIPAGVWSAVISGVLSGDITLGHINDFLKSHNIRTYSDPTDFPDAPNMGSSSGNINQSRP